MAPMTHTLGVGRLKARDHTGEIKSSTIKLLYLPVYLVFLPLFVVLLLYLILVYDVVLRTIIPFSQCRGVM